MMAACCSRPGFVTKRSGFTLIEILVVIVIIGIITSITILSVGIIGTDRALQQQAFRLTTLVEMASDEAQMQGREYGLELMRGSYRFVEFDPFLVRWGEVVDDHLLRPRQLEEDSEFELFLEDREVKLEESPAETERDDDRDISEDYEPHLLIFSSGDITPFEIRIVRGIDRETVVITMTPAGEMEVQTDDQATY